MKNNIKTVIIFWLLCMQSLPLVCMQVQDALQPVQQNITTGIHTAGIHTTNNFSYSKTGTILATALISGYLSYMRTKSTYKSLCVAIISSAVIGSVYLIHGNKAPVIKGDRNASIAGIKEKLAQMGKVSKAQRLLTIAEKTHRSPDIIARLRTTLREEAAKL